MSKKTQRILLVTAAFLVLVMALVLIYEFAYARGRRKKTLPKLPGWVDASMTYDPDLLSPGLLKIMEKKLYQPLALEGDKEGLFLVSFYETAKKPGGEGSHSNLYLASDQIMLGRGLARMGRRSDFLRWAQAFDQLFKDGERGFHLAYLEEREGSLQGQEAHWSLTLAFTRALLEGYQAFGGQDLAQMIQDSSDKLLPLFQEGRTASLLQAGPRMLLAYDEWDIPPPGTLPQPGQDKPIEYVRGTHLADVDLWALMALSRFNPAWAPLASQWQSILHEARLDSQGPLFASALEEDGQSYIPVTGGSLLCQTSEQIRIALYLAEVESLDGTFVSFLRSQLRDDKRLPSGWNPATGAPAASLARSSDYALALSLGRAVQDKVLIDSAREVLMYQYASSQSSDIFGGWYRPGETDRSYKLLAEDNAAVLVALR